jgi:hypothetical protein
LTVGDAAIELQRPHDGSVISIQFRPQVRLHAGCPTMSFAAARHIIALLS